MPTLNAVTEYNFIKHTFGENSNYYTTEYLVQNMHYFRNSPDS